MNPRYKGRSGSGVGCCMSNGNVFFACFLFHSFYQILSYAMFLQPVLPPPQHGSHNLKPVPSSPCSSLAVCLKWKSWNSSEKETVLDSYALDIP